MPPTGYFGSRLRRSIVLASFVRALAETGSRCWSADKLSAGSHRQRCLRQRLSNSHAPRCLKRRSRLRKARSTFPNAGKQTRATTRAQADVSDYWCVCRVRAKHTHSFAALASRVPMSFRRGPPSQQGGSADDPAGATWHAPVQESATDFVNVGLHRRGRRQ
jgi:hypothetical protein